MPSAKLDHLLPLWDSDSSASTTVTEKPEHQTQQQQQESMILISVPPSLESALRAVARCVFVCVRLSVFPRSRLSFCVLWFVLSSYLVVFLNSNSLQQ